jgi:zinc transport system substrate-binding protein
MSAVRKAIATVALACIGLTLVACSGSKAAGSNKVSITAAFYPLAFVAEQLGGSAVNVTNLTPPGAEPHDLELRPSDVVAIRNARIVLYLHGLQPAVDDAVKTLQDRARAFDALSVITPRHASDGSIDPHFWLDPAILARVAAVIEQRLEGAAPAEAALFQRNLTRLDAQLAELDRDFGAGLAHCARHEIFTGHAAFGYMGARYGLEQIAITGLNPEAEPSPKQLTEIIQRARKLHPTVIFAETLVSSRSVDAVARAVGAKVAVLDPIEGLLPAERVAGDDYLSLMRRNLRALEESLACQSSS